MLPSVLWKNAGLIRVRRLQMLKHELFTYKQPPRTKGRKLPHLGISYNPQTYDPVDVYIASRSGPTPLMHHPSAACGMFISSVSARNNIVNIMDIQLGVHPQASWHTTLWDFTQMVITK